METYSEQLQKILDEAPGTPSQKQEILFDAIQALAPTALQTSQTSQNAAGGEFLKILMDLLIQFLPVLLKLLAG